MNCANCGLDRPEVSKDHPLCYSCDPDDKAPDNDDLKDAEEGENNDN